MFSRTLKCVALATLLFFSWTLAGGATLAQAAKAKSPRQPERAARRAPRADERLNTVLGDIETDLAQPGGDLKALREDLAAKLKQTEQLDRELRKEFAQTREKLQRAGIAGEVLKRQAAFVARYDENFKELKQELQTLTAPGPREDFDVAAKKVRAHLAKVKAPSHHHPLDPDHLPFRQPKANKREPRMKREEFQRDLKQDRLSGQNQRRVLVASTGDLTGLLGPDELAETIEVQFTPEIRAKAAELGNNPVKIFNWVRNNIEFVPTWGSIQGAQLTLETKQGNAFDTASLLIALLRAAGIKARYVMGTVELPIAKVMNWAGEFSDPLAALDYFSSGGIPTKGLLDGGKIVAARIEHVWVEAYIDYIPSRGAKQQAGDTWISLDPSFKQYIYSAGIDLKSAVPFDAQSFLDQVQAGATIDQTQGYATGVNSLLVQQTMQDYQTRVQDYIQQNYPNATVGDVLGQKEVVPQEFPILLGTLPYRTAVKGSTFAAIPDAYRHKLTFRVESTGDGAATVGPDALLTASPLLLTKSLPELAGKKITLSYAPATTQDEAVLEAYLPEPHADGTPIQPSELPSSLPAYLINVKPELRIDGQVLATGAPTGLGGTDIFTMTFSDPSYGSSTITNYLDAGVFQAIGLNLGRISQEQLTALKASMEATKAKLENQDFTGLTKDQLVGDLLYTTAIAYHAELGTMNAIASRTLGVNALTLPSETIFATKLKVLTLWGLPVNIQPGGLNMDADYLMQVVKAKDGDNDTVRRYMLDSGMTSSALEHKVPEELFSTPDNPAHAISTVKALKIANDQGVPIYTVNQANIATVLPQLQLDSQVKTDIQNAVNAGKVVTVSKTNITFNSWTGCGYIIINPETGSGAYMISGGGNGGFMYIFWTVMWALAWVALITSITVFTVIAVVVEGALAAAVSVVVAALSELATWASATYLEASLFLAASPLIRALYATEMAFAEMYGPPSLPIPTSLKDLGLYLFMLRNYIIAEYIDLISLIIRKFRYPAFFC